MLPLVSSLVSEARHFEPTYVVRQKPKIASFGPTSDSSCQLLGDTHYHKAWIF
jgi:hypothetical protein